MTDEAVKKTPDEILAEIVAEELAARTEAERKAEEREKSKVPLLKVVSSEGSGKSYILDVASMIASGETAAPHILGRLAIMRPNQRASEASACACSPGDPLCACAGPSR